LNRLILADLSAKDFSFICVIAAPLDSELSKADTFDNCCEPLLTKSIRNLVESRSFFTEEVFTGNMEVFELHIVCVNEIAGRLGDGLRF